jgi:hypothetical protein
MELNLRSSVTLALCFCAVAFAVSQDLKSIGLAIRIGNMYPSTGTARDQGDVWTHVGAEFTLTGLKLGIGPVGASTHLSLSADGYQRGDLGALPVLLNVRTESNRLFFSAGAGLSFNREIKGSGISQEEEDRVRLAYQVGAGWVFRGGPMPMFLEIKYFGNAYDDLNGFALCFGIRL